MKYPVFLMEFDTNDFSIFIPDIHNAIATEDTIEEAFTSGVNVAHKMIEKALERGEDLPMPSKAERFTALDEFKGMILGFIEVDLSRYLGKTEKANITMPVRVIRAIDEHVKRHNIKSRSAYLTDLAFKDLNLVDIR